MSKADWIAYISQRADRYLYARGASERLALELPTHEDLVHFLDRLADAESDVNFLAGVYYLAQQSVVDFLEIHLTELIRSISHSTVTDLEQSQAGVRGKISWPHTLRMQSSGGGSPSTFVLKRPERSIDLPENRLLKLFLLDVAQAVERVTKSLGSGDLPETMRRMRDQALLGLRSPYLRDVHVERSATVLMHQRARRSRNWRYGELSRLKGELDAVLKWQNWDRILALLRSGWVAPIDDDDLFEVYSLVLVLDVLETDVGLGEPITYGLVRHGRKEVAMYDSDGLKTRVYFDQSPSTSVSAGSRYTSLLSKYADISGQSHRPDILVRFSKEDVADRYLVVEIKRSEDDQYKRDSVYKVFGYLYDFDELWTSYPTQTPKAVLLLPTGANAIAGTDVQTADLLLVSSENRYPLAEALRRAAVF